MAYTERYVTQGAGGTGDGSSGDPWTLAEGFANAVAGDRVNIQSDSAYSIGASSVSNAGSGTQLLTFRGYNSAIGDLDALGRNSNTTLNVTNFPVITLTGTLTPTAYTLFQNLNITGAISGVLIASTSVDHVVISSCKLLNTSTGGCVLLDNNCIVINCDMECSNTTHGNVLHADNFLTVIGCRLEGGATSGSPYLITCFGGAINNNAFIGTSSIIGLNLEAVGIIWAITSNTFYNLATAIQSPNSAATIPVACVNNHITDCTKMFDNLYVATANHVILEAYERTRDNTTPRTGISDESLRVGEVTTDTGGAATDYVDAPNGDITLIPAAPAVDAGMGM